MDISTRVASSTPAPPAPDGAAIGDTPSADPSAHVRRLPLVGTLQELIRLLGAPPHGAGDAGPSPALPVLRVKTDAVLLHEGASGHTLYVVRSGSFKCVRTLEDGYEQVLSFAQSSELLGFEALHGGTRQSSAVALEDSTVYALHIGELPDLQRRCPALEEAVRRGLSRQLARAAEVAEMKAAVASDARLGRFILWLSARMADAGQSPYRIHLRMGRRDIASLLGLAHETISRSFTMLVDSGCLRVDNREVEILDMEALRLRARNTRGSPAEPMLRRPVRRDARPATPDRWWSSPVAACLA